MTRKRVTAQPRQVAKARSRTGSVKHATVRANSFEFALWSYPAW
jgi:hypothetical protein